MTQLSPPMGHLLKGNVQALLKREMQQSFQKPPTADCPYHGPGNVFFEMTHAKHIINRIHENAIEGQIVPAK